MKQFYIAQIFGFCGAISLLLSSWQKDRKNALTFVFLDSLFYVIQYFLLGAFSGLVSNIISLIRSLIFKYKEKSKFLQSKIILYSILLMYLISGFFTYDGLASIFPVVVSIFYAIILWQEDIRLIRLGTAGLVLGWFIYNLSVGAYTSAVVEFILFVSSVISIIKIDLLKPKKIN